jgi:hypothetical protein
MTTWMSRRRSHIDAFSPSERRLERLHDCTCRRYFAVGFLSSPIQIRQRGV